MAIGETCLVTGGAGFIGCAISRQLCDRFENVVIVDSLHPQIHPTPNRPDRLDSRAALVVGDVTDRKVWDSLLASIKLDTVFHLAAETGTGQSLTESARHTHVNVTGTAVMLDALAGNSSIPRRIVLTSSRAVYGEGQWRREKDGRILNPGQRSREQLAARQWDFPGLSPLPSEAAGTSPAPVSVYGATKLAQEHILQAWGSSFGCDVKILRLQNVYGPGQSLANPYTGIVSLFCTLARNGESIPLYEDGLMLRDFILIDDVADALMAALDLEEETDVPFDIGTGASTTIADVAGAIARHYKAPDPKVCAKYRFGDVRHASCDVSRSGEHLGWRAAHGVSEGIERLAAWIDKEALRQ